MQAKPNPQAEPNLHIVIRSTYDEHLVEMAFGKLHMERGGPRRKVNCFELLDLAARSGTRELTAILSCSELVYSLKTVLTFVQVRNKIKYWIFSDPSLLLEETP